MAKRKQKKPIDLNVRMVIGYWERGLTMSYAVMALLLLSATSVFAQQQQQTPQQGNQPPLPEFLKNGQQLTREGR
ncbi:MAG: hypothetical protein WKF84_18520 [Pyrinomonadaceae bacterium]